MRFALAALLAAGIPAELRAQTTSASVTGSIQDPQGGVLPGVTVTLTSNTQGNVLTAVDGRHRAVRVCHRPPGHLLPPGHAAGLQDPRAEEPRRQRERQVRSGRADARSRRGHRASECLEPRHRTAVHERRARVHARKRSPQEPGQQRPHALRHGDAGPRRALRRTPAVRKSARSAASRSTASGRTRTTSRSTASPTSTPATTAATWRRRTSTPSPSSRF